MSRRKRLQVVGWGPIRLPGERRRIERLEKAARELFAQQAPEPPPLPEDAQAGPASDNENMLVQGPLGRRKLYVTPDGPAMRGPDVLDLQGRLRILGYDEVGDLDGVFGPKTRDALVRFQNDYGIFTDGVCARVSVVVLNHLQQLGVTTESPASDRQKRVIYWSVSAQRSGMVIVGTADRADAHGPGQHADFLARLRHRVEGSIETQTQMQTLPVQPDLSSSERASFANDIRAELVILLDVRDEPGEGGVSTYYFSKANIASDVGVPLANYIREELVSQTGAKDLGSHAEDSELLMLPQAPTVRVEIGNFGDPRDLARFLGDPEYFDRIGTGIALGITRVYMLGARSSPTGSAPVGGLSRRELSR